MCMVFAVSIIAAIIDSELGQPVASIERHTSFDSTVPIAIGNITTNTDSVVEAFITSNYNTPCTSMDWLLEAFLFA